MSPAPRQHQPTAITSGRSFASPLRVAGAAAMVVGVMALAVPAAARAGTYAVVSCPGDDGWSQAAPSALFVPYADDCGGDAVGGLDLALGPNPEGGYATTTGGAITFPRHQRAWRLAPTRCR